MKSILLLLFIFWTSGSYGLIRIGVLANRGSEAVFASWYSTAEFLEQKLNEDVAIIPIIEKDIEKSIASRDIDFILMDPLLYVENEYRFNIKKVLYQKRII
jgi:hypothetical protein